MRPQESFLIRIQNRHQRNLRQVQSFTQQIDTNQHVKQTFPQVIHNLYPLQGIHITMDIITTDTHTCHISRQLFSHPLRQSRYQNPFIHSRPLGNLFHQIIYLIQGRAHFNNRIQQSSRTNYLIDNDTFTLFQFIVSRSRTHINRTRRQGFKLIKRQRTVIHCGWQTETIIHQILLTGIIATIHGTDLWNRHMALIHHQQEVFREIIQQTERTLTSFPTIEIPGIILDTRTMSQFSDHLQIIRDPFIKAFSLIRLSYTFQIFHLCT